MSSVLLWLVGFVMLLPFSVAGPRGTEPRVHAPATEPRITETMVTFPQADLTLRAALVVLNQTGNPVVDYRTRQGQEAPDMLLKLPITPLRFWAAVDEVARQANLRVQPFWERGQTLVGLLARPEGMTTAGLPAYYVGPFRVTLMRVAAVRSGDNVLEPSRLLVTVQVAWEPRYRPLWLNLPAEGVEQRMGERWQPVPQLKPLSFRTAEEASVTLTVQLPLPPRTQLNGPDLRLRATVKIPPRLTPFIFTRIAEGQRAQADGVTCTLTRIEEDRRQRRTWINLHLNYPENALDLESHEAWVMQANTLILTPPNGGQPLRFTMAQAEINIRERAGIDIRLPVENLPQPLSTYALRYEAPAPPVSYPLEIRLSQVPLP